MKQVIIIKLQPSAEQHKALLDTLLAFNRACQYVADVAYEKRTANKIALQPFVYGTLRADFGLSSQMAIRAIAKACEAYKRDKRIHVRFDEKGGMVYDPRLMSFKGLTHVSLLCLGGRQIIPLRYGAYQAARLDRAKGQADLILRDGVFYLYVTVDLPSAPPAANDGVIGVDLGMAQLAVDSTGEAFSGEPIKAVRRRYSRLRAGLQSAGTKSAKRHLKRIRQKEGRFQRWTNHTISRHLVSKALAQQKALAIEDLSGINSRTMVRRANRYERLSWAFAQLRAFVAYKCEAAGVSLYIIDPRNTSRTCVACGHCAKENRRSQSEFLCVDCGFSANADFVASVNIARKGLEARGRVTAPMDALTAS